MLTFGQIRSRFEDIVGENVSAARLGSRIDEAQIEISKMYGARVGTWFPRRLTELAADITAVADTIPLVNSGAVDYPSGVLRLGTTSDYEQISYEDRVGADILGVERGLSDTDAAAWTAGTYVYGIPEAGVEHSLPADCLEVHEVRDEDAVPVFGYQISPENRILFFADGYFRVIYTRVPDPIDYTDNDAVPEVHAVFHPAIIKYCEARHWGEIAEGIPAEEQKANYLVAEFYRTVDSSAKKLKRNENQQYQIGIRLWS